MFLKKAILLLFSIGVIAKSMNCQMPAFQDGDRVCFIGSSITMHGNNYHYINLFYATRYPDRNITFLNCGITGDATDDMLERFKTDILSVHPNYAVLMIEENDLNPSLYLKARQNEPGIEEKKQKRIENWCRNADSLVSLLTKENIKVILEAPTIYDQTGQLPEENAYGVNDALGKCVEFQKHLSKKYGIPLVNVWSVMKKDNAIIQSKDPTKTIIGHDRVHVSPIGYFIMAYTFLHDQDVEKKVADIKINASKSELLSEENCTISNIQGTDTSAAFDYLSKSLPFPTPDGLNPDTLHPFTNELNSETLLVNGLKPGNYKLAIGFSNAGIYSDKDFQKGINLSQNKSTPQYKQSQEILDLFNDYWKTEYRLRILKYIEISFINGKIRAADNMDSIKTKFEDIVNRSKKDPNYQFFKNVFGMYVADKPNEKALEQLNSSLYQAIQAMNKPKKYSVKIEKTM